MKLLIIPLLFTVHAFAESSLCRLSLTTSKGQHGLCNAVHIGQGKFLTSRHCFRDGENALRETLIIARCGDEELSDFIDLKLSPQDSREDIALLVSAVVPKIKSIVPTQYPAMYFDSSSLKKQSECEVISLRDDFEVPTLHKSGIINSSSIKIAADGRITQALTNQKQALIEGDSGGAFICRYSKNARFELIGINASYTRRNGEQWIFQNTFSSVFGKEAKVVLRTQ